jgi:hypothetical protein
VFGGAPIVTAIEFDCLIGVRRGFNAVKFRKSFWPTAWPVASDDETGRKRCSPNAIANRERTVIVKEGVGDTLLSSTRARRSKPSEASRKLDDVSNCNRTINMDVGPLVSPRPGPSSQDSKVVHSSPIRRSAENWICALTLSACPHILAATLPDHQIDQSNALVATNQAARRPFDGSSGASVSRSANGRRAD